MYQADEDDQGFRPECSWGYFAEIMLMCIIFVYMLVSNETSCDVHPDRVSQIVHAPSYILPKIIGEGSKANAETNDTVTVSAAALSLCSMALKSISVLGSLPVPDMRPMVSISPRSR